MSRLSAITTMSIKNCQMWESWDDSVEKWRKRDGIQHEMKPDRKKYCSDRCSGWQLSHWWTKMKGSLYSPLIRNIKDMMIRAPVDFPQVSTMDVNIFFWDFKIRWSEDSRGQGNIRRATVIPFSHGLWFISLSAVTIANICMELRKQFDMNKSCPWAV